VIVAFIIIVAILIAYRLGKNCNNRGGQVLAQVYFERLKNEMDQPSQRKLQALISLPSDTWLQVEGYADSEGPRKANHDLSMTRAQQVADYLVKQVGFDPVKIHTVAYGETFASDCDSVEQRHYRRGVNVRMVNFSCCDKRQFNAAAKSKLKGGCNCPASTRANCASMLHDDDSLGGFTQV